MLKQKRNPRQAPVRQKRKRSARQALVRIDARIPAHVKEGVIMAAGLQGRSQTDFLVSALTEATKKAIDDHNVIRLCLEDQKAMAAAILGERPEPKGFDRLCRAARDHARRVESR